MQQTILCITETHQKYLKVNITDKIINVGLHSFRKIEDKKGGGLEI